MTEGQRRQPPSHYLQGFRLTTLKRSSHVKTLRLRGLRPQLLGSFHGHCALWAGPPLIIDVAARPDHQCGDFRWIAGRVQGLAAYKAWRLTLSQPVAAQELLGIVDSIRFGPMMREHSDHIPHLATRRAAPASNRTAVESHVPPSDCIVN